MLRSKRAGIAATLAIAGLIVFAPPSSASYSESQTVNGCRAYLFASRVHDVQTGADYAYAETSRSNAASCSLAAYVKYRNSGGTTVYTSSTDWDATWAHKNGPNGSTYASSGHYVNYNGPLTGRWFALP